MKTAFDHAITDIVGCKARQRNGQNQLITVVNGVKAQIFRYIDQNWVERILT